MSGLENIIAKINSTNENECGSVVAVAEKKAAAIIKEAENEAERSFSEVIENAEKDAALILQLANSTAEKTASQIILDKKVSLIYGALKKSLEAMESLGDVEYFDIILALAEKNAMSGEGIMKFSACDLSRLPEGFEDTINRFIGECKSVKISDDTAEIKSGFMLIYGDIEINCTFESIFEQKADDFKLLGNKILFES